MLYQLKKIFADAILFIGAAVNSYMAVAGRMPAASYLHSYISMAAQQVT